ncbi:MAG: DUF3631 domain-containing protein [Bryobacteraceae bacterium]
MEDFIKSYSAMKPHYYLPVALWAMGTYCYRLFDAYPRLVVTAVGPASGKTRLLELIKLLAYNAELPTKITAAAICEEIEDNPAGVTLLIDEAEKLSRDAAGGLREVLNNGYRQGGVYRTKTQKVIVYCPVACTLIGDVNDTLRSRSIIVRMTPAIIKKRFTFAGANAEAKHIVDQLRVALMSRKDDIESAFLDSKGLDFLDGRDEELWTPLFALCDVYCPDRRPELERCAADIFGEKRTSARYHVELKDKAERLLVFADAQRLMGDILTVAGKMDRIRSGDLLELLKAQPRMTWRTYQGTGLDAEMMGGLLAPYECGSVNIRFPESAGKSIVKKGYYISKIREALKTLEGGVMQPEASLAKSRPSLTFEIGEEQSVRINRACLLMVQKKHVNPWRWHIVADGKEIQILLTGDGDIEEVMFTVGETNGITRHVTLDTPPTKIRKGKYRVTLDDSQVALVSGRTTYMSPVSEVVTTAVE